MMLGLLSTWLLVAPAKAEVVSLKLEGMICQSCEVKLKSALDGLDFLDKTIASTAGQQVCAELTGTLDTQAIHHAIRELGYTVRAQDLLDECPDLSVNSKPQNWAETGSLDAKTISQGEQFEIDEHLVQDKFTVFDFGASWCGPCHAAERLLKLYMADHPDVAVRAVVLAGDDPRTSFSQPVVAQHLSSAPGLPYFMVFTPDGKLIYRGVDCIKVLKKIDRRRR